MRLVNNRNHLKLKMSISVYLYYTITLFYYLIVLEFIKINNSLEKQHFFNTFLD